MVLVSYMLYNSAMSNLRCTYFRRSTENQVYDASEVGGASAVTDMACIGCTRATRKQACSDVHFPLLGERLIRLLVLLYPR